MAIFDDSIPKWINTRLWNTNLIRSKAISKCLPEAASNDFIHYIKPNLQNPENQFEAAISHGINGPIKRSSNIDVITKKNMNVANKCKKYGIKNIFVSDLTINNRLHSDFIYAVNKAFKLHCVKYGYNFIENSNIRPNNPSHNKSYMNYFLRKPFIQ